MNYTLKMDPKYLPLGRRNQITLPKEMIAEGATLYRCEKNHEGTILLTPHIAVPISQANAWTRRAQPTEKKAVKEPRVLSPKGRRDSRDRVGTSRRKHRR